MHECDKNRVKMLNQKKEVAVETNKRADSTKMRAFELR